MSVLAVRKEELGRHVENIPLELAAWQTAAKTVLDMNAHFNQLEAIGTLVNVYVTRQKIAVKGLSVDGDPLLFQQASFALLQDIVRAQRAWDFFRDKLDLRHSPAHKDALWVADTVAFDCHRTTLNTAVAQGILNAAELREPPLVYCTADTSPATWVRGSRPNDGRDYDLGEATVPIPVIELPWDHLGSAWEYLSLHHEVGHDIEADLGLRDTLQTTLKQQLTAGGVPAQRVEMWLAWQGEVFADLCALRLGGPAFVDGLMQLLLLPTAFVKKYQPDDPHPTPFVRMLMNIAYARTLGTSAEISAHADSLAADWRTAYGDSTTNAILDECPKDFPIVFAALMATPLAPLKGQTVASLLPYTVAEDLRIRAAEKYFRTGDNPPIHLPIRHVPGAARLAVKQASTLGTLTPALCQQIHDRVFAYVRQEAPPGLRGAGGVKHQQFIAGFADRMLS